MLLVGSELPKLRLRRPEGIASATPYARWTPYVGFGIGASFPHVDIRRTGTDIRTFEYQLTGVAVEGLIGLEHQIGPRLSTFADYKLSFSSNDADVKGGGTLETDVWTNHVIFGLSYRFRAGAGLPCR